MQGRQSCFYTDQMSSVLQLSLQYCLLSFSGTLWENNHVSSARSFWKHSCVEGRFYYLLCFLTGSVWESFIFRTYQISALHFNVQIAVQFFSFCRLPNRPIINTPVVSTAIHSDGELPPNLVEKPIIVEYAMLETEERTKPVCVFWNHSITYVSCLL